MTSGNRPTGIQWEDEDTGFGDELPKAEETSDEFAAMLAQDAAPTVSFMVGEKVKGIVSRVPAMGDIMVDLGGKSTGIIERAEFAGEADVPLKVGDTVEAFVVSKRGGEIVLSYKLTASMKSLEDLERAHAQKLAVRGRVVKAVKGGFEVMVLGKTAFCPISQIDARFVEDGSAHVGKEYEFLVERLEGKGRNIVLTRAALLRKRAEERAEQLMRDLTPEQVLDGTVTEVRDFGAFVDIGGVDGLVHISALSHARVSKASDIVNPGDKVRVKVLKIERDAQGRPKISLSMKAASQDPWDRIDELVATGKSYTGRVVNLMAFGAFIEIAPGVEGLLHVSEMSWMKRIHHPSELVAVGDMVTVTVKDIDRVQRRISLSMKQIEDDPWFEAANRFPVGRTLTGSVERLKPFGAFVELAPGVSGLVPMAVIKRRFGEAYRQPCTPGKELEVKIQNLDTEARKIQLTLVGVEEEEDDRRDYLEFLAAEKAAASKPDKDAGEQRVGTFGALLGAQLNKSKR